MKIGIDSKTLSHNSIATVKQFNDEGCDVVICASGAASEKADGFAVENGYRVIWTSLYQVVSKLGDQRLFAELNKIKAKHLVHLLNGMDFPV